MFAYFVPFPFFFCPGAFFCPATALEALGNSSGAEVDCLQRALAKAREAARERPLEVQIKECREFISRAEHRVVKLEADVVAEKTMLEEGRARLSQLEQQSQVPLPVHPPSRVAELEQQITALVQERDAFRAAAIPTKKRSPVTPRPPQSSQEAFDVLMTRAAKRHAGRPWRKMCCQRMHKVWQNG